MFSVDECIFIDIETGGFSPVHHEILEFSAIYMGESVYTTLIRATHDVPYAAEKIHGINFAMTQQAPTLDEAMEDFAEIASQIDFRYFVAHNAEFEQSFLDRPFARTGGVLYEIPWRCSMEYAKARLTGVRAPKNFKNSTLFSYFRCDKSLLPEGLSEHTAEYDALMTYYWMERML